MSAELKTYLEGDGITLEMDFRGLGMRADVTSREQAKKLADQIMALADIAWPKETPSNCSHTETCPEYLRLTPEEREDIKAYLYGGRFDSGDLTAVLKRLLDAPVQRCGGCGRWGGDPCFDFPSQTPEDWYCKDYEQKGDE